MACSVSTVIVLTEGSDFAMLDCRRVTDGKLSFVDSKPARDSRGETTETEPTDSSCQWKLITVKSLITSLFQAACFKTNVNLLL